MNIWSITNLVSGADLGGYEADDEDGALDAMAHDAGYADFAASCSALGTTVAQARRELKVALHTLIDAPTQKIAAIGTDGIRDVVWGIGDTVEEAIADAEHWLVANQMPEPREHETCTVDELRMVEITEERYQRITAGDVDASDL